MSKASGPGNDTYGFRVSLSRTFVMTHRKWRIKRRPGGHPLRGGMNLVVGGMEVSSRSLFVGPKIVQPAFDSSHVTLFTW